MDMMQLFTNLKGGNVDKLYLFYGPEDLLIKEAVNRIKGALIPASLEYLNLTIIDGDTATAESIVNACETLPFMNKRRLVIVNNVSFTPSGKRGFTGEAIEKLHNCFEHLPSYICLVITAKGNPDRRTKLMKTVKTLGNIVEFEKLKQSSLEKWVAKRFAKDGKSIPLPVLKRFIELTGYQERDSDKTLEGIANEIKKVVQYCDSRTVIRREDVEALAPESLNTNIFKLVDSIGGRDISKSFALLEDMKRGGEPPIRVLFMISRQFRLLLQTSLYKERGYSSKAIASKLRLPPFVVVSLMRQADNFAQGDLKDALKKCGEADMKIKSGGLEPWIALELFVAGL